MVWNAPERKVEVLEEKGLVLRPEQEADFPAIYDLVRVAFQTARVSSGDEQNFVNRLRAGGNYIPALALVAADKGGLVGHIMLTRTCIDTAVGDQPLLLLGPLAVVLARRGAGLGSQLVREALRRAEAMGYTTVILVGDPAYYSRFGFEPSSHFGISNTNGIPDANVLAYELVSGALRHLEGAISFQT
jgi:predicted N-acetyltransferase YhbS